MWTLSYNESHKRGFCLRAGEDGSDTPSALHWAACLGITAACKKLIEGGADVNKQSNFGQPLHCAILSLHAMTEDCNFPQASLLAPSSTRQLIVGLMINAGAHWEFNALDLEATTALQLAFAVACFGDNNPAIMTTLLETGCQVSPEDSTFFILIQEEHW